MAFDTDNPGEQGAAFWLEKLPNAVRAYPLAHDINDMLQARMDIRAWLRNGIERVRLLQ